MAVGLLLTGFCGYLLYSSLNANSGVGDEYKSTLSSLTELQNKSPYPAKENIEAAKADQIRVRDFLNDFRRRFAPFTPPPYEDQKGFKTYLEDSLYRFHAGATNAGVLLPDSYFFSFSSLMGKLTYSPECIGPWMQQLEEISAILDILYRAKINYLDTLQRVPVCSDDGSGQDYLSAASVTNQWGVVTPYKMAFRCFSGDLAAVLEGFARSSNCFIVKDIDVLPSKAQLPVIIAPPSQQVQAAPMYVPRPQNPYENMNRGERYGMRGFMPRPMPRPAPMPMQIAVPAAPSAPETILSENPLYVTLSVDVVKLNASEHH